VTPETSLDETLLSLLQSPINGRPLDHDGTGVLSDGQTLWPCVDGIPYLRLGRDVLRRKAVDLLRQRDPAGALALLLADRKDDSVPPAPIDGTRYLSRTGTSAVEAMERLRYGGLAWYMLHRWSQPTYLSGLALVQSHARAGGRMLDLGCGAGQYLRAWQQHGPGQGSAVGSDIVFSHLWIAKTFVAPGGWYLCHDANGPFPLRDGAVDVILAQDSFHYLPDKRHVMREMRRVCGTGIQLIGHVHNAGHFNYSAGLPLTAGEYVDLIEPDTAYDDADLTRAALTGTIAPALTEDKDLDSSSALAFATGAPRGDGVGMTLPPAGTALRLNPMLATGTAVWPSAKFEAEFVSSWEYLRTMTAPPEPVLTSAARGGLGADPEVDANARTRTILDLPERWL
jgi:SAM-dependent methyltransferase